MNQASSASPFSRVRVIDMSENVAGPVCTKLLAALGAEVIKVERPAGGDPIRALGPFPDDLPHPEKGGLHLYLNMGKKSVTINWALKPGRELLKRLLAKCDVLVESTTPGTLERLGLDYRTLQGVNPSLIMASVTPFGQTGPYRNYKAPEIVLRAVSGEISLAGEPDRPPLMKGGLLAQYHGGLHAFIAVMAALYARERLGYGQQIDISMVEGWASVYGMALKTYTYKKQVTKRRSEKELPGGLRQCKDGWIVISGRGGRREWWPLFVKLLDMKELREERFSTPEGRAQHKDELEKLFTGWLMQHTKEEVYHKAQQSGLAAAYVCDAEDLLSSPQHTVRNYYQRLGHPAAGTFPFPSLPFRMGRTPWENQRAPLLGEHNGEVYHGLLGLAKAEIESLRAKGVI